MEQIPEANDPVPTSEDAVLDELHGYVDTHVSSPDALKSVHSKFERCEAFGVYEQYEKGILPTLSQLKVSIEKKVAQIESQNLTDPEEQKTLRLLKGRPISIESAIKTYVQSVIRFNRLYKSQQRGRDVGKFLEDADRSRRRAHNNLFDSLAILSKTLKDADNLGLLSVKDDVFVYQLGSDMRVPDRKIPAFAADLLAKEEYRNRKFIMEWAIAADFEKSFKQLQEIDSEKV